MTRLQRKPDMLITSHTAQHIGANVTLELTYTEATAILAALNGERHRRLSTRESLAHQIGTALITAPGEPS